MSQDINPDRMLVVSGTVESPITRDQADYIKQQIEQVLTESGIKIPVLICQVPLEMRIQRLD